MLDIISPDTSPVQIARTYPIQICGNRHAHCAVCRPEVTDKIRQRATGRPSGRKGKKYPGTGRWRGKHLPLEMRAKISATVSLSLIGNQRAKGNTFAHTQEAKTKIAIGIAKAYAQGAYWHNGPTYLEYALQLLLEDAGFEFEAQKRFGRYVVDAYVPSRNLVFEADGMFWNHHKDKIREAKRDKYLVDKGATAVVHLTEADLDPWRVRK